MNLKVRTIKSWCRKTCHLKITIILVEKYIVNSIVIVCNFLYTLQRHNQKTNTIEWDNSLLPFSHKKQGLMMLIVLVSFPFLVARGSGCWGRVFTGQWRGQRTTFPFNRIVTRHWCAAGVTLFTPSFLQQIIFTRSFNIFHDAFCCRRRRWQRWSTCRRFARCRWNWFWHIEG